MSTAPAIVDDPRDITAEWLTEVLHTAGVEASVRDVVVTRAGTGQIAATYRLEISYASGDGPASLIAKLPSTDPVVRTHSVLTYRCEVGFYRDLAHRLQIDVPHCWSAVVTDDATDFTLLLEDLSGAAVGDQLAGCTVDEARAAAVEAAGLHAPSWCNREMAAFDWLIPPATVIAPHTAPRLLVDVETFIERRPALDAATRDVLRRFAASYTDWVFARPEPWSLVHSDFRLDNLLFAPPAASGRRVTTVDWASLAVAQPVRDVAYLLGTGLDPADRRAHERDIVAEYHDRLCALGVHGYGDLQCWDDYRHGLFHGHLICIMGDAVATPTERGLQMFTAMAERCTAAVLDLDCLELLTN